jgi:hypothetical protein
VVVVGGGGESPKPPLIVPFFAALQGCPMTAGPALNTVECKGNPETDNFLMSQHLMFWYNWSLGCPIQAIS